MAVTVRMNEAAVRQYIAAPDGQVGRWLMVVGEQVKRVWIASLKEGFPRDHFGPQIVKRWMADPAGPRMRVGVDNTRTEPHIITGNPLLFFVPTKGVYAGRLISKHQVNHPGSNFDRYLTEKGDAALAAVRGTI